MILFLLSLLLREPESVMVLKDTLYVIDIGEYGLPDGSLWKISMEDLFKGKNNFRKVVKAFITPEEAVFIDGKFYIVDLERIWAITPNGRKELFIKQGDFWKKPQQLSGIATDGKFLYVSDRYDNKIFKINLKTRKIEILTEKILKPGSLFFKNGKLYVITYSFPVKLFVIEKGNVKLLKIFPELKEGGEIYIDDNYAYISGGRAGNIVKYNLKTGETKIIKSTDSIITSIFKYKNYIFYIEMDKKSINFLKLQ